MPDALSQSSNRLESLVDFLSKVTQVLSANSLYDLLFLVSQRERLTQVSVRKRLFWFAEQSRPKLIADNRCRKEPVQGRAFHGRLAKGGRIYV
jgi:hypothetical protein